VILDECLSNEGSPELVASSKALPVDLHSLFGLEIAKESAGSLRFCIGRDVLQARQILALI
jgi:hypothetical protein